MVKLPTSGPHMNFQIFFFKTKYSIALNLKVIVIFVGMLETPGKSEKPPRSVLFVCIITALWVLKLCEIES